MTKLRAPFLLLILAFLAASLPGLSAPLTSTPPALCAAGGSATELPFLIPAASDRILPINHPKCGNCSVAVCRGAVDFSQCGVAPNGQLMHCDDAGTCPVDGLLNCSCAVNEF